ncbi:MAG: alpha-ribazole phosphatase [Ferruginibacter sp.]
MEIYLIRHTEPAIAKGICYGQSDLDVTESFSKEAVIIQKHLPARVTAVYSSPLQRCKRLAEHLFADQPIQLLDDLKEIDCGKWELQLWDDIPKAEIEPWTRDLINVRIPGGESYQDVFDRVSRCFNEIITADTKDGEDSNAIIVAHGGVIRSILSHITQTPLLDSFKVFPLHYGCVVRISLAGNGLRHEVLSNIAREKETHKPSN